ncbi:MAG: hypothetical protein ACO1OF_16325 [Adhaeribacter sp.]
MVISPIRQTIILERLPALSLIDALTTWLEIKLLHPVDYTVVDLLAVRHLSKLKDRLVRRTYNLDHLPGLKKPFKFSLSQEEIFSVLACIKPAAHQFLLIRVYGEIQKVSLNYPQIQFQLSA